MVSTILKIVASLAVAACIAQLIGRLAARRRLRRITGSALVTGASAGIGRELALQLAGRRCDLVLVGTREVALQETKALCIAKGARSVELVVGDITSEPTVAAIERVITTTLSGRLDALVLNAGVGHIAPFEDSDPESIAALRRLMEVNLFANARITQVALRALRAANGRILVISSLSGFLPTPLRTAYCASKHAVQGFFGALRNESGIIVTIVCPSWVQTGFHDKAVGGALSDGESKKSSSDAKFMTPAECARQSIDALERGAIEHVMTTSGKAARLLYPWFPALISSIVRKKAQSAHHGAVAKHH